MVISSSLALSLSSSSSFLSTRPPSPHFLSLSSSRSSFFTNLKTNSLVVGPRGGSGKGRKGFTCYALFGLGVPELVVIAGVAALVFGPKKLPEVGKSIGKTVKSFQQAAKEFESELKKEPDSETDPPGEKPTAISEERKDEGKISSSKESV
ncbi:hypothetical protein CICLE_v10002770mg [Citrus x clementina]|uniref:Sec-independent protein translocase protein TATA, chloroplastic n=3 Tax=Citrus TaxID=2706 RepID=A0A067E104_CITSI|nr:sec-independent protein translocase protein TATA, chloroplastic [Citrus x clementina]ESR46168.1 hypothetical protein CICLE_v10002770mg [Citrus x clementina]KAH9753978.1 Sec-independent protein translocase protein TATA [Citrus sinensis]KDO48914.1 hypothetical protein CISIN_1g031919mg [Citrus sinensis]